MSRSEGLVYVEAIKPRFKHATSIESLTLQDAVAGGFENPRLLGDPSSFRKIARVLLHLLRYPEQFSGYTLNGELVAFMKQNYANAADHMPLSEDGSANEWAVFGLVASDQLADDQRQIALVGLLQRSLKDSHTGELRAVNIPIHQNDPLLKVAKQLQFVAVGTPVEVPGAPGLKQQWYRHPASE